MKNKVMTKEILMVIFIATIILSIMSVYRDVLPPGAFGTVLGITLIVLFTLFNLKEIKKGKIANIGRMEKEFNRKKRNFSIIDKLYKNLEKEEDYIDDQTWMDLEMDKVYSKLDYTLTTPGEQALYNILRKPDFKEEALNRKSRYINLLEKNKGLRNELQGILYGLDKQYNGDIIELLFKDNGNGNKYRRYLYNSLAILSVVAIVSVAFLMQLGFLLVIIVASINMYIHYKINKDIMAKVNSITYLSKVLSAAQKICKVEGLSEEFKSDIEELKNNLKTCSHIAKNSGTIGRIEGIDALGDYINVLFLSQVRGYYNVIDSIRKNKEHIKEVYYKVGELDALISIAVYRNSVEGYVEPQLSKDSNIKLEAKAVKNPLVEDCVPNDIIINNNSVILTGTNMSGKSTFLRTIGVNALLAQTVYTCLADSYVSSYYKILSSISPKDDIALGKSYYLGEAESLLRIINKVNEEVPVLCIIDEIFRGTNPVERISASAEILNYLIHRNTLSFVATHDLDLINIIDKRYIPYYFSEEVDEEEGLSFDYEIKTGINPTRNAIKLLKYIGYPKEITERAEARIVNN